MNRPPPLVMLVGHPLLSYPIIGLCLLILVRWFSDAALLPLAILALIALCWTLHAGGRAQKYRAWLHEWEGMAGRAPRFSLSSQRKLLGVLILVGMIAFMVSQSHRLEYRLGLVAMPLVALIGGIAWAVTRYRQRRAANNEGNVTIAITAPLLPTPDLAYAYNLLPPHCWQILDG